MSASGRSSSSGSKLAPLIAQPRVLVVDRDESSRALAVRALEGESLDVRSTGSVPEALTAIADWKPAAIIIDLVFENDSGLTLIRDFRRRCQEGHAIVIVVSALDNFDSKLASMRAGSDVFFSRPADWDSVARRLVALLHRSDGDLAKRVLLVEDDVIDASRIRELLGTNGFQVLVCDDPRTFAADLDGFQPDLILMDVNLPGVSGFELARLTRQDERFVATPILFLTVYRSEDATVAAIASGGDDHLVKPVSERLLLESIEARIHRSKSVKSLLERDGLTGLLTHAVVMARAVELVQEKNRHPERDFTLALLDIDHFKTVNDRFGHVVGDKVLASLAGFLRAQLRSTDVVGRYGGEEFVVVLPDTSPERARPLFARLLRSFSSTLQAGERGELFHVTFSGGLAGLESGWSLEEWKVLADEALYQAKNAGRNQIVAARPDAAAIKPVTGILDPAILESLRELGRRSNTDLLTEVSEMFLRIAPERMETLRKGSLNGDLRAMEMTAHAFRSSAANLGASTLASLCEDIENLARKNMLTEASALMPQIELELDRVIGSLRRVDLPSPG